MNCFINRYVKLMICNVRKLLKQDGVLDIPYHLFYCFDTVLGALKKS